MIFYVDIWSSKTVNSQHVLKVVFSSLLSEPLPRFGADSPKPATPKKGFLALCSNKKSAYDKNLKSYNEIISQFTFIKNAIIFIDELVWRYRHDICQIFCTSLFSNILKFTRRKRNNRDISRLNMTINNFYFKNKIILYLQPQFILYHWCAWPIRQI